MPDQLFVTTARVGLSAEHFAAESNAGLLVACRTGFAGLPAATFCRPLTAPKLSTNGRAPSGSLSRHDSGSSSHGCEAESAGLVAVKNPCGRHPGPPALRASAGIATSPARQRQANPGTSEPDSLSQTPDEHPSELLRLRVLRGGTSIAFLAHGDLNIQSFSIGICD